MSWYLQVPGGSPHLETKRHSHADTGARRCDTTRARRVCVVRVWREAHSRVLSTQCHLRVWASAWWVLSVRARTRTLASVSILNVDLMQRLWVEQFAHRLMWRRNRFTMGCADAPDGACSSPILPGYVACAAVRGCSERVLLWRWKANWLVAARAHVPGGRLGRAPCSCLDPVRVGQSEMRGESGCERSFSCEGTARRPAMRARAIDQHHTARCVRASDTQLGEVVTYVQRELFDGRASLFIIRHRSSVHACVPHQAAEATHVNRLEDQRGCPCVGRK